MNPKKEPVEITKAVTIHDIARSMDVSSTTVWRALKNSGRISAETRERILKTVDDLGYQPSMVAQSLRKSQTNTIGVVVPDISAHGISVMVRKAEQIARKQGFNIMLCDTDMRLDLEQEYIDMLQRRRVEGMLLAPFVDRNIVDEYNHLIEVEKFGVPVVSMENIPVEDLTRITTDNFGDARMGVRHLISLGHRRIGFCHCGIYNWNPSVVERYNGYMQALNEVGIPFDESLVVQIADILLPIGKSYYSELMEAYLRRPDRPSAIFISNDMTAMMVLTTILDMGLRIPEDIAIVSFDNLPLSIYTIPPLTTIQPATERVADRAAELLFQRIKNKNGGNWPIHERLPGTLIVRKSCGAYLHE